PAPVLREAEAPVDDEAAQASPAGAREALCRTAEAEEGETLMASIAHLRRSGHGKHRHRTLKRVGMAAGGAALFAGGYLAHKHHVGPRIAGKVMSTRVGQAAILHALRGYAHVRRGGQAAGKTMAGWYHRSRGGLGRIFRRKTITQNTFS